MELTVLSHAGLEVRAQGRSLVCDPWLVGSAYWRSWWNYPPVDPDLVAALEPDVIALTHTHWDHFHGVSLRRFPRSTPILVPRGHHDRMRRDLRGLGFRDVRELRHGETVELAPGFTLTSYQFSPFLDSVLAIEADGVTVLDVTDAKITGLPLRQVLERHPHVDFVLRSHSSANSRLCFEIIDDPEAPVDDEARYVADFAAFAQEVGATYAIPFASNHCFLHREVFPFNDTVRTPRMVEKHFADEGIAEPQVQVMVSGDSWSSTTGFAIQDHDWFERRDAHLAEYQAAQQDRLDAFYAEEAAAEVTADMLQEYFEMFAAALPALLRRRFVGHPVAYVLTAGDDRACFEVDVSTGSVRPLEEVTDTSDPLQIHTGTLIMLRCMDSDLFSHLAISKRVRYRVTRAERPTVQLLNLAFNLYEYDYLPLRKLLTPRFVANWARRWREPFVYARLVAELTGRAAGSRRRPGC